MTPPHLAGRLRAWSRPSRIWLRLLAFNLLLLFLPIAGILYLDVYEARLLDAQERAMGLQARLVAAALADRDTLDSAAALNLFERLGRREDTRLRVYDDSGALVADSARVRYEGERDAPLAPYGSRPPAGVRDTLLYRVGAVAMQTRAAAGRWLRRALVIDRRRQSPGTSAPESPAREVRTALAGKYGAATRPTPGQRSLTLTTAVPIRRGTETIGAVLVSQTTFRVLSSLYDVRLRIFEIVVASIAAGALLTALAAATVVRPLTRLQREATALADRRARLPGTFEDARRRDEIGELARALQELTRRLDEHIRTVEGFASDVAHEFKNPLASIRTAAEMAMHADEPHDRERFLTLLVRDADRLERLVSDVRELARIDTQLEREPMEAVDVGALVARVCEGLRFAHGPHPGVAIASDRAPQFVRASADRLAQAFENVLSNARGFAPADSTIDVIVDRAEGACRIRVLDRGPGIPEAHLGRIFERFFTYRPAETGDRRHHAGLGLAIARTIVEGYGGTIAANHRDGGGACFEIRLPASPAPAPSSSRATSAARDRGRT